MKLNKNAETTLKFNFLFSLSLWAYVQLFRLKHFFFNIIPFISESKCVIACPRSMFADETWRSCRDCPQNCLHCSDRHSCLQCDAKTFLQPNTTAAGERREPNACVFTRSYSMLSPKLINRLLSSGENAFCSFHLTKIALNWLYHLVVSKSILV